MKDEAQRLGGVIAGDDGQICDRRRQVFDTEGRQHDLPQIVAGSHSFGKKNSREV
jgi:hypothetical protein